MSDDLVERVAREFCVVDGTDPCEVVCGLCLHRARLVVAVVLKEAARVAAGPNTLIEGDGYRSRFNQGARIAAAIRALVKEPTDPGPASGFGS